MGDEYPNISQARQSKGLGEQLGTSLLTDRADLRERSQCYTTTLGTA